MKPSSGALVILDCDGVLFDSFEANVAFYNAVLGRLGEPPLDDDGREHAHRMATPQVMKWLFGDDPAKLARAMEAAYATEYAPFLAQLEPVPELFETLRWLRDHYRTAMATNRGATIPELVAHFELAPLFEMVVGIRDVKHPKPAPDMLFHCLEGLGVESVDAVYVGDSPSDLAAAQAASIRFIGVGGSVEHDTRIEELRALPELLRSL
ncbi:MAG: HAD family hydrolase [Candidatus Binatia bacterium]|nr:HAD family hydrolase [Candidatus Binatia bacterium]